MAGISNVEIPMTKEIRMTKPDEELTAAEANPQDNELIDRLMEHNPKFRRILEEKPVSIEEARKRLLDDHGSR